MFMVGVIPACCWLDRSISIICACRNLHAFQRGERGQLQRSQKLLWRPLLLVLQLTPSASTGSWLFAIFLMTGFNFFSHGTQDLYATFLRVQHHFDDADGDDRRW